ncbi:MAG: hypothetical protein FJW77_12970, partial [Actinobacteria bacterium]|nr:hypothetical protein [Actinomycetota bacterium]
MDRGGRARPLELADPGQAGDPRRGRHRDLGQARRGRCRLRRAQGARRGRRRRDGRGARRRRGRVLHPRHEGRRRVQDPGHRHLHAGVHGPDRELTPVTVHDPDPTGAAASPYAGLITFARRPATRDLAEADIAVVGIPFDGGTTHRPGARFGPRAIREQSLFVGQYPWGHWPWCEATDARAAVNLWETTRIVDWGDVPLTVFWPGYPERMVAEVRRTVAEILATDTMVLALGGDHMVSYPLLAATAERHGPLSLVHFDAHCDTWDMGDDLNHGTMFRLAVRDGFVDPSRSIQVGMRTPNPDGLG